MKIKNHAWKPHCTNCGRHHFGRCFPEDVAAYHAPNEGIKSKPAEIADVAAEIQTMAASKHAIAEARSLRMKEMWRKRREKAEASETA